MGEIEQLDSELASLAQAGAALRLRLGQLLEVIGRGAVFELGFSSLGAYAAERCERSARWAEGARAVARRLEELPELRLAVATGSVSWSMAELLAQRATSADEVRWLVLAESRTVRQMRVLVADAATREDGATVSKERAAPANERSLSTLQSDDAEEICTLTCTVDREDAWLFEATRCLLEQLGERNALEQSNALLAEAQTTLLGLLPRGGIALDRVHESDASQSRWLEQLQRWRTEAEVLCEKNILGTLALQRAARSRAEPARHDVVSEASGGMTPLEQASATVLDREVHTLAAALARHDLDVSRLALRLHRADGWRRLGYASEAQYARERLGSSSSSLRARRTLALRLERLPRVTAALAAAHIGVEAASQLVRIATAQTEAAWVERARSRTLKHLREEVAAALVAVRVSGKVDCPPPADSELAAFQTLEQAVVSGRFTPPQPANAGVKDNHPSQTGSTFYRAGAAPEERSAWWQMLGGLAAWVSSGCQTSGTRSSAGGVHRRSFAGRVTLRLRMSRQSYLWWRGLEAQARRWLPAGMSWLRFLCLSVWHGWGHLRGAGVAYGQIYIRDRYRCTSPVCTRQDVTPHHLHFRSAGGSDDEHNVASLCTWCHLHGVHGGRIRALGPAGHIRWELGPRGSPVLIVHGRVRMAA